MQEIENIKNKWDYKNIEYFMVDSLVAINIISNDKLINKNGTPLLFYWDGKQDINEALHSDKSFLDYLYHTVLNKDNFTNSIFSFFQYYIENENEHYKEDKIIVQDFIKFKDMDDNKVSFYKDYLLDHFLYLYKSAYHEEYDQDISIIGIDDSILNIYDKIQEKYPKKVIKTTVVNYIRSELMKTDNLNIENTDWIIFKLENLLNERI